MPLVEQAVRRQSAPADPTRPAGRFWTRQEHERFLEGVSLFGAQDAHSIAK